MYKNIWSKKHSISMFPSLIMFSLSTWILSGIKRRKASSRERPLPSIHTVWSLSQYSPRGVAQERFVTQSWEIKRTAVFLPRDAENGFLKFRKWFWSFSYIADHSCCSEALMTFLLLVNPSICQAGLIRYLCFLSVMPAWEVTVLLKTTCPFSSLKQSFKVEI